MITFGVVPKVLVSKTSIDKYLLHANLRCCCLHLMMLNVVSALLSGQNKGGKMGNIKKQNEFFFSTVHASKRKDCV